MSRLLVVAEMALAVVLLAGAGLMIRSFVNIQRTNPGITIRNLLVMRLFLPEAKYHKDDDQVAFHDQLKARLEALPGVDVTTIAVTMPTGGSINYPYEIEHAPPTDEDRRPNISVEVISPDYFRAMDVRILRGRAFTDADNSTAPPVILVNQRMSEKLWPGDDPIGKRLRTFENKTPGPWATIVGIAPNILQNNVTINEFDPLIYVPYRQKPLRDMSLMARTRVPPGTLATAFRQAVMEIDAGMPIYNLRTMEERLALNYWAQGIFSTLFSIFAGIALALAGVGLYAVIAHSVTQRTSEIGLRMALGASGENILRLVFVQGIQQLAIGLLVGLLASIGLTRALRALLAGVSPTDVPTLAGVCLVLAGAAVLGCWIPARRAMRVDPVVALRHE